MVESAGAWTTTVEAWAAPGSLRLQDVWRSTDSAQAISGVVGDGSWYARWLGEKRHEHAEQCSSGSTWPPRKPQHVRRTGGEDSPNQIERLLTDAVALPRKEQIGRARCSTNGGGDDGK